MWKKRGRCARPVVRRRRTTDTLRCPKSGPLELACFDVVGVFLNVRVPLFGKVVQREDRRNWADRYTGAAVDALDRVNEELVNLLKARATVLVMKVLLGMDAVHGAGIHAGRVFNPDTGFCNYVCHYPRPSF